jgi:hypothetical protein
VLAFSGVGPGAFVLDIWTGHEGWLNGHYAGEPSPHITGGDGVWRITVGTDPVDLGIVALVVGSVIEVRSDDAAEGWFVLFGSDHVIWGGSALGTPTLVWPGTYKVSVGPSADGLAEGYLRGPAGAARAESQYFEDGDEYTLVAGAPPLVFNVAFSASGTLRVSAGENADRPYLWQAGKVSGDGFVVAEAAGVFFWGPASAAQLLPGSYAVAINRQSNDTPNAGGFYAGEGKTPVPKASDAAAVSMTAGASQTIHPVLAPCATVTGTLVGAVTGAEHEVFVHPYGDTNTGRKTVLSPDEGLNFTIPGLWPGKWTVRDTANVGGVETTRFYNPAANDGSNPGRDVLEITSCNTVADVNIVEGDRLPMAVGKPAITGTARVGSALTVAAVATTPAGGTVTYDWLVDAVVKKSGTDAAARTYTPVAADVGKELVVNVWATRAGYETARNQSAVVTVQAASLPTGTPPASCGLKQVVLSPRLMAAGSNNGVGDGQVVRVCNNGDLWLYDLVGNKLAGRGKAGSGFGDVTVYAPGDWNRDGFNDLIGIDKPGLMWLYKGQAAGGFAARQRIGSGWGGFKTVVPVGDITGDGNPDLLAVQKDGIMKRYEGNGRGGWKNSPGTRAGSGWRTVDLLPAGDVTGDGNSDIFGISRKTGELNTYAGRGNGGFRSKVLSGTGWRTVNATGGASLNGDAHADLIGVGTDGAVNFYRGRGNSTFGITRNVATNWK